ncbi:MAG TPA: hypothetical protein VEA19_05880 [Actinomycetota bacterium]|nr:hypothetical protein [Actinomycetota bacterium]
MRRTLAAAALAGAFAGAVLTSVYLIRDHRAPLGFDTARYVWRNRCVAEHGFLGLREICTPPLATSMPSRVGYPAATLPVRDTLRASDLSLAAAMPVAFAVALGLAAGGLVTAGPGSELRAAITAAVVGTSAMTFRMLAPEGYADNVMAAALGVGSLAAALQPGRRAAIAASALLGAAGITHWPTFVTFVGVAAVAAVLSLPEAIRGRLSSPVLRSVAARWALVAAGGVVIWAAGALMLGRGPDRFFADPTSSAAKLRSDVAAYLLPVVVPLAAAGAWVLSREREERRSRMLERVLVSWIAVIALAIAAWVAEPALPGLLQRFGQGFPLHRFLLLALPVPILVGISLSGLMGSGLRRGVSVALVVAALAAWAWIGLRLGTASETFISPERVRDAATAARYLEAAVPRGTPVIVVVDGVGVNPFTDLYLLADTARIPLAPERVADLRLYLGSAENLLQRTPTLRGEPAYDGASTGRWAGVLPVLSGRHVSLVIRSFTPEFHTLSAQQPDRVAAPGVLVLEGPLPDRPIEVPEEETVGGLSVLLLALAAAALLSLIGLGWSIWILRDRIAAAFLAPVVGAGLLALCALPLARTGVPPSGGAGVALVVAIGFVGWLLARRDRKVDLGSHAPVASAEPNQGGS